MWCFACHVFRAWLITAFVLPFGMSYSCRWTFGLCFLLVKATFNRYRPECVCYMHLCPPPSPPRFEKDPPPVLSKCARSNAFLQQHLFPQNLLRKWRNLFHQLFNWAVTTMKWLKMINMPSCICRHARGHCVQASGTEIHSKNLRHTAGRGSDMEVSSNEGCRMHRYISVAGKGPVQWFLAFFVSFTL